MRRSPCVPCCVQPSSTTAGVLLRPPSASRSRRGTDSPSPRRDNPQGRRSSTGSGIRMAAGTPPAVGVAVPVEVVTGGRHGGGGARRNRRRSSSTGVDSAVLSSVRAAVEAELRDLLTHEIRDKIGREVESTVRPRIERELRSKFHTDLQAALKKQETVRGVAPILHGSCELRDSSCVPCAPNVQELTKGDPQLRMEAEQLRAELESETKRRQLWQAVRRSSSWRWV